MLYILQNFLRSSRTSDAEARSARTVPAFREAAFLCRAERLAAGGLSGAEALGAIQPRELTPIGALGGALRMIIPSTKSNASAHM